MKAKTIYTPLDLYFRGRIFTMTADCLVFHKLILPFVVFRHPLDFSLELLDFSYGFKAVVRSVLK